MGLCLTLEHFWYLGFDFYSLWLQRCFSYLTSIFQDFKTFFSRWKQVSKWRVNAFGVISVYFSNIYQLKFIFCCEFILRFSPHIVGSLWNTFNGKTLVFYCFPMNWLNFLFHRSDVSPYKVTFTDSYLLWENPHAYVM